MKSTRESSFGVRHTRSGTCSQTPAAKHVVARMMLLCGRFGVALGHEENFSVQSLPMALPHSKLLQPTWNLGLALISVDPAWAR